MKINLVVFFSLLVELPVFFLSETSALRLIKIANLGTINNVTSLLVNISIFDVGFKAIAEVSAHRQTDLCEREIKIRTGTTGIKVRHKPKGTCANCCKIQKEDVRFLLYTQEQPNRGRVFPRTKKRLRYPDLNKYKQVIIFIHGFLEVLDPGNAKVIKDAYLSKNENYAVILLDWSDLSSLPWYFEASYNTRIVGNILGSFLEAYVNTGRLKIEKVHLIGFSLGAHVAGIAGKYLKNKLRIPRITGLDPAYPTFEHVKSSYKLSKEDADFVDVIHTDAGKFGIPNAMGHVDFYPNKGNDPQPGCNYKDIVQRDELYMLFSCSHNRAFQFYVESVYSPYNFPAVQCNVDVAFHRISKCNYTNVVYMGITANDSYSGVYYLKTNALPPYGRSNYNISYGDDEYKDFWA